MTVVRKIQIALATLGLIAVSHPAAARAAANTSQAAVVANSTGGRIDEQDANCGTPVQAAKTPQVQSGEK